MAGFHIRQVTRYSSVATVFTATDQSDLPASQWFKGKRIIPTTYNLTHSTAPRYLSLRRKWIFPLRLPC